MLLVRKCVHHLTCKGLIILILSASFLSAKAQSFGDNMGNHTAAMDLNMKSHNVVNAAGVAIGNTFFINSNIALQIDGANKAILISRVYDTLAIDSPVNGMLIYTNSDNKFYARQANAWFPFANFSNGQTTVNGELGAITISGDTSIVISKTGKNISVSANYTSPIWNAGKLMNQNLSAAIPQTGQVLVWNDNKQWWEPGILNNATNLILPNGNLSDSLVTTINGSLRKLPISSFMFISDTSAMLSSYLRSQVFLDSIATVQTRLQTKLSTSDTAAMLSNYLKSPDIAGKLNVTDTASMLSTYLHTQVLLDSVTSVQTRLQTKLSIRDTATMLANYLKSSDIAGKLNVADTTSMLSTYLHTQALLDSLTSVQTKIQTKLSISDTAAMLSNYLKSLDIAGKLNVTDTASMLSSYLHTQVLLDSLTSVQTRLQTKLSISDTAAMLSNYLKSPDIAGKLNVTDTASMLSTYLHTQVLLDSVTSVQTRLQTKMSISDTAAMLSNYLKLPDIAGKLNVADT